MKSLFAGTLGAVFVIGFIVVLLALGPMIMLWSVNTLAEQAKVALYIPHNIWTYLAGWGLMAVFAGK